MSSSRAGIDVLANSHPVGSTSEAPFYRAVGDALRVLNNRLTVDDEALRFELLGRARERRGASAMSAGGSVRG